MLLLRSPWFPHRPARALPPLVEMMEPRQLLTAITATSQGPAHDSKGRTTTGWTGFLLTVTADAGQVVSGMDMGENTSSANGIFGAMLQSWNPNDGDTLPSPTGTTTNGSITGCDSHVLIPDANRIDITSPVEDNDGINPAGAPADDVGHLWGTGSYLRGVWGISGGTNSMPLAYVVLKDGTTGSYAIDVAEKVGNNASTVAHVTGTLKATTQNPGTITGIVFSDISGDGARQSATEQQLANRTVYLDLNNSGTLDSGDVQTVTNSSGAYQFTGLTPGTYSLREVVPNGWRQTAPSSNGAYSVTVTSGITTAVPDFGVQQLASISGIMFNDNNGNGVLDSGEKPLVNWACFIDFNNNGVFDGADYRAYADANGKYTFPNLVPGTYHIHHNPAVGWRRTVPSNSWDVTVKAGDNITGKNIGDTQRVLITGTVFNDANANKIKDSTETGLSGWRVYFDMNNDGKWESTEPSTLTDSVGNWKFTTLAANTFVIRVTPPTGQTGWTQTTAQPPAFTLSSAGIKTGLLFGERKVS
jgi:protocatechuate 3,4-dioxygenase beta subunit